MLAVTAAVLLVGGGTLAFRRSNAPNVPTAQVKRGEFVNYIPIRGNVKAQHSIQIAAPSIAGDLQIVKLVPMGTMVKKGDVIVQFDTTTLQATLDQRRSELKSAGADSDHSRGERGQAKERQAADLVQARYKVDRAKLETSKQEILSEIDGAETRLKLHDAEQKYRELQQKDISTKDSTDADIDSKTQKREKSLFDVRLAERQIASLTLRAPADGMVTIMPNFRARNWTTGGSTPDFKEGDRAWSGAVIAQLPDLKSMRVSARVDEISPLAKLDYSSWPFIKNFDIALEIFDNDSRIRPGMSASGRIAVEKVPDALLVPVEAVFEKDGRLVAYALRGSRFEERTVEVARRGKTELLIARGLEAGERVALMDPTQEKRPGK